MNNATSVIFRAVGGCLRESSWLRLSQPRVRIFEKPRSTILPASFRHVQHQYKHCDGPKGLASISRPRNFSSSPIAYALRPSSPVVEQGLAFRKTQLTSQELQDVFGQAIPPAQIANRLLRVLHGRRVDGTLDVPLPRDLHTNLKHYPYAAESALFWLRSNHDVDEDAAIIARIEREEMDSDTESPSAILQRGQNLGVYDSQVSKHNRPNDPIPRAPKESYHGPQSGRYRAKLGEKGDVFGRSELDRIRAENEAKAAIEEEKLEQQITQITERETKQRSQDTALAQRPEQGIQTADDTIRPPNEFDKWVLRAKNRSTSELTLDSPEIRDRSAASRLIPSLLLTLSSCAALYLFVQWWTPPKRPERIWPDMALSFATVCGLIAANVVVFALWRFPPAWPLLNRYFLMVPVTIQPLSLIGSIFSHSKSGHLLVNSVALIVFGPSLHEDFGRAQFLACYLASGIIGNYVSLAHSVSRGIWIMSSLGASGSAWGILAAYCNLHSNDRFTIAFLPKDWKEVVHIKGWMFLLGLVAYDCFGLLVRKNKVVNYWAHFGGAATGWAFAELWKRMQSSSRKNGDFVPKPGKPWWEFVSQEIGSRGNGSRS